MNGEQGLRRAASRYVSDGLRSLRTSSHLPSPGAPPFLPKIIVKQTQPRVPHPERIVCAKGGTRRADLWQTQPFSLAQQGPVESGALPAPNYRLDLGIRPSRGSRSSSRSHA